MIASRCTYRASAARRELAAGTVCVAEDLTWVRPAIGLAPGNEHLVLGRQLLKPVSAGSWALPERPRPRGPGRVAGAVDRRPTASGRQRDARRPPAQPGAPARPLAVLRAANAGAHAGIRRWSPLAARPLHSAWPLAR